MKTIGLITMHRVVNFGSVLQAYATQQIIEKLGYSCSIIDYQYPNEFHLSKKEKDKWYIRWSRVVMQLVHGFPSIKQERGFQNFRTRYLKTTRLYPTRDSLFEDVPNFDAYIVGSDQTWNVRHMVGDDVFLLAFTESQNKISYSSSAARVSIADSYVSSFRDNLMKFKYISVRERNTQVLVKNLTGRDVPIVLDPTLLLGPSDWNEVAKMSKLKIRKPFILAYVLKYSFYPYPLATQLIRMIHDRYKMPVVLIRYSMREKLGINEGVTNLYEGIAPEDFVWLFQNASFVVTTSFHGTAFAINYRKPFYAIYDPEIEDDRIISLLSLLGIADRGVSIHEGVPDKMDDIGYDAVNQRMKSEREKSVGFLKNAIEQ